MQVHLQPSCHSIPTNANTFAAIAIAFTIGALANQRRSPAAGREEPDAQSGLLSPLAAPGTTDSYYLLDNTRFRNNLISRFLARFTFLFEMWYWNFDLLGKNNSASHLDVGLADCARVRLIISRSILTLRSRALESGFWSCLKSFAPRLPNFS